ncbi:MAG: hypothetical protein A3F84_13115 [Candidatus Handelsmanbacteria bacterium RIFCSPLOWO2_12_FULL_64_10]|uniref:Uncharacterized protein n=1 Tax=Handelsmanbacteria sp. (strain RIFCSPLOWO2_12_FULL_64_10) TaxID=1817868 RepID=A0A1F6D021_HANXR|nr:MAG: hypothetical protein A3F84_13115 [Candidatus Handelsmanbacteria bacterium RIFCSPLOWO2_12_FULL_64_10]
MTEQKRCEDFRLQEGTVPSARRAAMPLGRRSFLVAGGAAAVAGATASWRFAADDIEAITQSEVVAVLDANMADFHQYEALVNKALIPSVVIRDDLGTLWMRTLGRLVAVSRPVVIGRTQSMAETAFAMLAQDFGYRQRSPVAVSRDADRFWAMSPDRPALRPLTAVLGAG